MGAPCEPGHCENAGAQRAKSAITRRLRTGQGPCQTRRDMQRPPPVGPGGRLSPRHNAARFPDEDERPSAHGGTKSDPGRNFPFGTPGSFCRRTASTKPLRGRSPACDGHHVSGRKLFRLLRFRGRSTDARCARTRVLPALRAADRHEPPPPVAPSPLGRHLAPAAGRPGWAGRGPGRRFTTALAARFCGLPPQPFAGVPHTGYFRPRTEQDIAPPRGACEKHGGKPQPGHPHGPTADLTAFFAPRGRKP